MKINIALFFLGFLLVFSSCEDVKQPVNKVEEKQEVNEEGISVFDSLNLLIKNDPTNPLFYNDRANIFIVARKFNAAMADINTALTLDTLNPAIWITLADIYFLKERFVDSREVLLKTLSIDPKNTTALLKLARLNLIYRDYKQTKEYVDKALIIDPLLEDAYFIQAIAYAELGDTNSSVFNYQKAVEINPDFYDAWLALGALSQAQDNKLAEQYYLNALEIDTNNTLVLYSLALYYQQTDDFTLAEKYYKLLLMKEESENALFNMGYINLVYLNDYPMAITYFQKALNVNPEYSEALFNLAFSLELSGDKEDAREKYKELLRKVPNHAAALKQLNNIDK